MKGVVLVKFNEFVEEVWDEILWDDLLTEVEPTSGGVYTSVATYPDEEFFAIVEALCAKKQLSHKDAQMAFGKWLFIELYKIGPANVHDFKDTFEFLYAMQNLIHVEVQKLNPTAILPQFTFLYEDENELRFHYASPRKLCFFCEGLIAGLAEHLNQAIETSQTECEHSGDHRCVIQVKKIKH